jgi:DNA-binding response OmpR family regulator
MNALAIVIPEPVSDTFAVAVRLADEGIPVRAIARATHLPSEDVYEALREAILRGSIVDMPRDDWPPGNSRSQRSVFNGTPLEQEQALKCACARFFKTSPLEAAMLALMLKRTEVTKQQLHLTIEENRLGKEQTDPKMVDVMICKLRKKLKLHDVEIETMWGIGYLISSAHRERAIQKLLAAHEAPNG